MVRFKRLSVRGMFSYGVADLEFRDGVYLLEGRNLDRDGCSNMAGKSALWDSLTTILYEQNSRGQVKDEVVNSREGKCSGVVELEVNGRFVRVGYGRGGGNSWWVEVDGQRRSYAWNLMRGVIEGEVGLSYDEFVLSSWFQQGMMDSFLVRSDAERKELFASWLGLGVFKKARERVKERRREVEVEIKSVEREVERLQEIREKVKEFSEEVKVRVEEILGRYREAPVSVEEYRKKRKQVLEDLKKWRMARNVEVVLRELQEKRNLLKAEVVKEREKLRYVKDGRCWVCGRVLDEKRFVSEIVGKVEELEGVLGQVEGVLRELERVYVMGKGINRERLIREMCELRRRVGDVDEWRWAIEQKAKVEEWERLRRELEREVDLGRLERLRWELEVAKVWEKGFSDDGIVAYILERYLEVFNRLMERYGRVVGISVRFGIGKRGQLEVEVSDGYKSFSRLSYFSGSERYLVMLVVMLGLSDFLRLMGKGTNLLVLDEVFAPFDVVWRERLVELLEMLKGDGRMVVVITHHDDVKRMVDWDGVMVVEKRDGISRLVGR